MASSTGKSLSFEYTSKENVPRNLRKFSYEVKIEIIPADIPAGRHAALHRLGHVPRRLDQLILAQRVGDGGRHHLVIVRTSLGCPGK
jgi:hypothetical protein